MFFLTLVLSNHHHPLPKLFLLIVHTILSVLANDEFLQSSGPTSSSGKWLFIENSFGQGAKGIYIFIYSQWSQLYIREVQVHTGT